jgi:hypothetical protein
MNLLFLKPKLNWLRWLVPTVFIIFILGQAFFSIQKLTAITNFINRTSYFDILLPASRVEKVADGIVLKQEPVYIDIILPLRVSRLALEFITTADSAPLRFALKQESGRDFYFLNIREEKINNEIHYFFGTNDFRYLEPNETLRFIVSAPNFNPGTVVVKKARLTVERNRFSWVWFSNLFKLYPERIL